MVKFGGFFNQAVVFDSGKDRSNESDFHGCIISQTHLLLFGDEIIYSKNMPKSTRKKSAKTVKSVKRSRTAKAVVTDGYTSRLLSDNKLVISALVLLLAVALVMLVQAWMGVS